MNVDGRIEVVRVEVLEFNRYSHGCEQLIVWERNADCDIAADWVTRPCGEWAWGLWLDDSGVIVVPDEVRSTKTWIDVERAATKWWADHGWLIRQGGIWR